MTYAELCPTLTLPSFRGRTTGEKDQPPAKLQKEKRPELSGRFLLLREPGRLTLVPAALRAE